jgi:hypothetical protein
MAWPKFTEEQCKKFEEEANPHQWFLTADLLHDQAVKLHAHRGQGDLTKISPEGLVLGQWTATRCLIPDFDGAILSCDWRDALWARFFTGAPQRQRGSVEQYKIVKRA